MAMDRSLFRASGTICANCRQSGARTSWPQSPRQMPRRMASSTLPSTRSRVPTPCTARQQPAMLNHTVRPLHSSVYRLDTDPQSSIALGTVSLGNAQKKVQTLLNVPGIPSEEETIQVLQFIESAAEHVVHENQLPMPVSKIEADSSTSALLSLSAKHDRARQGGQTSRRESAPVKKMIDALSDLAFKVVEHPPVFLTPEILKKYVEVQSLLLRPQTFADVFDMYTHKPAPKETKDTGAAIEYQTANPKAISVAIDPKVADKALEGAIHVKDLTLALDIIETTYQTPSFTRAKIFRKALPPLTGAALMPVAAWSLASQLSAIQTGLTEEAFTQIAFAGMFTYASCVGTIGYVALTTANDQMQRVTWAEGMPLRERWVREEERAALDKVALAWGLRQRTKWGEEEGAEWDELKEYIGMRGMILDKVGLMDGMQ